jgi:ribonuclease Z
MMTISLKWSAGETIFRLLTGFIGILFLNLGIGFVVFPDILSTAFFVYPAHAQGLNAIRGDFGGLFLGMSFFCLLGAATGKGRWLVVPIIFLVFIVVGRSISLFLDGFSTAGAQSIMAEIFFITVLTAAITFFARKSRAEEKPFAISEILNRKSLIAVALAAAVLAGLIFSEKKIGLPLARLIATDFMTSNVINDLSDGLHVALVGSGCPLTDMRRVGPCTAVIAGKHLYVVDTGPSSVRKLEIMRFKPDNVKAVLLTHFHSDHIGDLGELMLKRWAGGAMQRPLDIYGPAGVETVVDGFNLAYSQDSKYRVAHHGPETAPPGGAGGIARPFHFTSGTEEMIVIDSDGLTVTAFVVDHEPVNPAVGYRFDYKGRSVVISGDTVFVPSLVHQARGADLLVMEALQPSMVKVLKDVAQKSGRPNNAKILEDIPHYHASPEDGARIARDAGVSHLLFTHIVPPLPVSNFKPAFLGDANKIYSGPITIGEDGMLFSLPAGSDNILRKWLL